MLPSWSAAECMGCSGKSPAIPPHTEQVWAVWIAVSNQWRHAGMDGTAVALDYNALYKVADSYGLEMTAGNLRKLRALEGATLEHWRKKNKPE